MKDNELDASADVTLRSCRIVLSFSWIGGKLEAPSQKLPMTFKEEPSKMILESTALMMAQQSLSVTPQNLCPHCMEVTFKMAERCPQSVIRMLAEHCIKLVEPVQKQA